jgi:hypothetical protein
MTQAELIYMQSNKSENFCLIEFYKSAFSRAADTKSRRQCTFSA